MLYKGADKSLARPTSRCILFDCENISFDISLVIYLNSTNIPPIMIINRILLKSKSSVAVTCFLPVRAKDLPAPLYWRWRWAWHVARMGESRGIYRVLVRKPEWKRPQWRPRRRWEDNIKMDLQEMGCKYMDWINVAQYRDRRRALVNAVMNLRFP